MPTIRPCSITTREPRFSFAMVLTASTARPPGSMLRSRLPLTRKISLTCMARPPSRRYRSKSSRNGGAGECAAARAAPLAHHDRREGEQHAHDHDIGRGGEEDARGG